MDMSASRPVGEIMVTTDQPDQSNTLPSGARSDNMSLPKITDIASWLERPMIYPAFTWRASQLPMTLNNPFVKKIWDSNTFENVMSPIVKNKLKNHQYVRAKSFTITLRVNAQPFQAGLLKLWWDPIPDRFSTDPLGVRFSLAQINDFENVELDLNTSKTVSLEVPFLNPYNWIHPSDFYKSMGHFYLSPITSLLTGSTVEAVECSVLLNISGVELCGPTASLTAFESNVTFEQADVMQKRAPNPAPDTESGSPAVQCGGPERSFDLAEIYANWNYFAKFDWKVMQNGGLTSQPICPAYFFKCDIGISTEHYWRYCSNTSAFFFVHSAYWRADVRIRVKIPRTKFHSGSLILTYDPADVSVLRDAAFQSSYSKVINLKDDDEDSWDLLVPFNSRMLMQENHLAIKTLQTDPDAASSDMVTGTPMGRLTISVMNPLVAPATVSQTLQCLLEYSLENVEQADMLVHDVKVDPSSFESNVEFEPSPQPIRNLNSKNDMSRSIKIRSAEDFFHTRYLVKTDPAVGLVRLTGTPSLVEEGSPIVANAIYQAYMLRLMSGYSNGDSTVSWVSLGSGVYIVRSMKRFSGNNGIPEIHNSRNQYRLDFAFPYGSDKRYIPVHDSSNVVSHDLSLSFTANNSAFIVYVAYQGKYYGKRAMPPYRMAAMADLPSQPFVPPTDS
ncbi:TPA_asm: capsid protein precursor [Pycnopodia helianthoides associated picornavirus 1]|nr:TPA_asm: capsid protein precursor [Pycnopodia helianthoides associated picornavirus 1]